MRISRVFAIVLAGAGTTATAQPLPKEDTARISYIERKQAHAQPKRDGDWIEIASPTPASHGTEFVVIGKDAGELGQLRITPSEGKVMVRRLKVYFDDGKQKTVDLDKVIDARHHRSVIVELGVPRTVDRIVVTTEPYGGGSYSVYATPAAPHAGP
jgi:hypothetical protein